MNCIILFVTIALALSGCANKEKYELAKYRTTAAVNMYTSLQTTRQVEALSKETIAMASMGFVEKGCGNECDKPKKKELKKKSEDCSRVLEKYDKSCDSAKSGSAHEEVCNVLYSALEAEKKRCEEDSEAEFGDNEDESVAENDSSSSKTETVNVEKSQGGGEVNKAMAKAVADSDGSTVINNFIGDNNTSGSYNPTASGAGSVFMGSGDENGVKSFDAEAASILSLAGKEVKSDAAEAADGYLKPVLDTAKAAVLPLSAAYAISKAIANAGDSNSNNPNYDLSNNSTNVTNPEPEPEPVVEEVLE